MTQAEQNLAGVTVLNLGQIYNGPYATFLLALLAGARVIKVESGATQALTQPSDSQMSRDEINAPLSHSPVSRMGISRLRR